MSNTKENPVIAATTGAAIDIDPDKDRKMTDETAARLRQICERSGEAFDTALTENEAQARIEALEQQD